MTSLVRFGFQSFSTTHDKAVVGASLQRWFAQFRPAGRDAGQRVALLDNSLVARVAVLLGTRDDRDSPRCTAEGLIALNAWLHAVVLYDRVVHLENVDVTLPCAISSMRRGSGSHRSPVALSQSRGLPELLAVVAQLRIEAKGMRRLLREIDAGDADAMSHYDQAWVEAEQALAKLPSALGARVGKAALKGGGALALAHLAPGAAAAAAAGFVGELIRPAADWSAKALDWVSGRLSAGASADAQGAFQTLRDRLTRRPGVFIAHLIRADRGAAFAGDRQALRRLWGIDDRRARSIEERVDRFAQAARPLSG